MKPYARSSRSSARYTAERPTSARRRRSLPAYLDLRAFQGWRRGCRCRVDGYGLQSLERDAPSRHQELPVDQFARSLISAHARDRHHIALRDSVLLLLLLLLLLLPPPPFVRHASVWHRVVVALACGHRLLYRRRRRHGRRSADGPGQVNARRTSTGRSNFADRRKKTRNRVFMSRAASLLLTMW
ncbi:hypothetical protein LCGC14_2703690 [marine sediment metagenome]|uniref:Uncharacterized protein n=1 Tax=marine sediment metagenome TaxID=412755 RepID=A0A0F8ZEZ3_9ZZZZ